jgi:FRG domain
LSGVNTSVNPINIQDWFDLEQKLNTYFGKTYTASWAFRGVGKQEWGLQSSLERMELTIPLAEAEQYLLNTFQRRVHHYICDPPTKDDYLEWLALLQHHGAPTRLLDWTKSPYVALFFALVLQRDFTNVALATAQEVACDGSNRRCSCVVAGKRSTLTPQAHPTPAGARRPARASVPERR